MKSPQASVRQCAMRVFKLLGGDTLPEAAQAAAGSTAGAAAVPDLMTDLLGEADTPAAAPASQDFLGMLLRATSRLADPHDVQLPLQHPSENVNFDASCMFVDHVCGSTSMLHHSNTCLICSPMFYTYLAHALYVWMSCVVV